MTRGFFRKSGLLLPFHIIFCPILRFGCIIGKFYQNFSEMKKCSKHIRVDFGSIEFRLANLALSAPFKKVGGWMGLECLALPGIIPNTYAGDRLADRVLLTFHAPHFRAAL